MYLSLFKSIYQFKIFETYCFFSLGDTMNSFIYAQLNFNCNTGRHTELKLAYIHTKFK